MNGLTAGTCRFRQSGPPGGEHHLYTDIATTAMMWRLCSSCAGRRAWARSCLPLVLPPTLSPRRSITTWFGRPEIPVGIKDPGFLTAPIITLLELAWRFAPADPRREYPDAVGAPSSGAGETARWQRGRVGGGPLRALANLLKSAPMPPAPDGHAGREKVKRL